MKNYIRFANQALTSIYKDGAYASIVMGDLLPFLSPADRAIVTKLVYGVLERNEEFGYMISKLCKKQPRPAIRVILRLGMYLLKYMDSIPDYAVVNEIVELTKTVKKEQAGFVNATLKFYIKEKNNLPDGILGLSVKSNYPIWLIEEYIEEYGLEKAKQIIFSKFKHTHLRLNKNKIKEEEFEKLCAERKVAFSKTDFGYLITSTSPFKKEIEDGVLTLMALDSIKICKVLVPEKTNSNVLDLCSAPGGKAVFLAENNPNIKVFACDVHPHRVELIKSYARRMEVQNVEAIVWDSTVLRDDWIDSFDLILLDVPCSGVGVINSNPDIILNRTKESVEELNVLQSRLLKVASKYLRKGGRLVYSTCSNLKKENLDIVNCFLKNNQNFELCESESLPNNGKYYTFENDEFGNEGFFVANLRRKEE